MTEHAASSPSRLRRPTLGQWIGLIVAEVLVWVVAVVVEGYADWPVLPWIVAIVMVLVLVGWVLRLRSLGSSRRRGGERG